MATPGTDLPELFHFEFSHYNESVRWALDYKRVPHLRHPVLPGPHAPTIKKLTGATSVPVLRHKGRVLTESADIVDYIDQTWPDPPLLPGGEAERNQALEIRRYLVDEVGQWVRAAFFNHVFPEGRYAARLFAQKAGATTNFFYAAGFPMVRALVTRVYKLGPETEARGIEVTRKALDLIAEKSRATGYLAGNGFTVADLTAAALLAMTFFPPQMPVALLEPRPAGAQRWLGHFAGHEALPYLERMYTKHRPPSAAVAVSAAA